MPSVKEINELVVSMKKDLIETGGKNLIGNEDTKAAWGNLNDNIKQRNKDELGKSFEYLENIIHRDFRVKPERLLQERKEYARGRASILSTCRTDDSRESAKPSKVSKRQDVRKTVEKSTLASSSIEGKRRGAIPKSPRSQDINHIHVERPHTGHGTHRNERESIHALQSEISLLQKKLQHTEAKLRQTEADKEYWVTRMSKMTGDKLTRDNPDITDLSDPNRPLKLGEKYMDLYDDEWTDAMEMINKTMTTEDSERRGIEILINILQKVHGTCIEIADEQMRILKKDAMLESNETGNGVTRCPIEIQSSLKDLQKQTSVHTLPTVQQIVRKRLETFREYPLDKLTLFIDKCTEICWGMVVQSPRMTFSFPTGGRGEKFDKAKFREFTRSGNTLDFVVWPALVVQKEGSLLMRGVVQPFAKK